MQSQVVVTIKLGEQKEIHKLILQEFQYGSNVFQTTTNRLLTAMQPCSPTMNDRTIVSWYEKTTETETSVF